MATIGDVARMAGVSQSTVSCALSGKKYVSAELMERIKRCCEALNYAPSVLASSFALKKTGIIGLFLDRNENVYYDFFDDLIRQCILTVSAYNYKILVFFGKDQNYESNLAQGKSLIDAAIVLAPENLDERIEKIQKLMPVVVIGRPMSNAATVSVDIDNKKLVFDVTSALIGEYNHRNILFINSNANLTITADRKKGFVSALMQNGIDFSEEQMTYLEHETAEEGYKSASVLLQNRGKYSAIIVSSVDAVAGIYRAAEENGLKIPKDLSVFALGGEPETALKLSPRISYAHQDYALIARCAMDNLLQMMNGASAEDVILENSTLTFAESCVKLKT